MPRQKRDPRNQERKPQGKKLFLGSGTRKIHPKLRMIANCKVEVNEVRAEHNAAVMVERERQRKVEFEEPVRGECPKLVTKKELKKSPTKLKAVAADVMVNTFIRLNRFGGKKEKRPKELAKSKPRGNLVIADIPLSKLKKLAEDEGIAYIELGEPLKTPIPIVTRHHPEPPTPPEWPLEPKHKYGQDILIGIIDVQGFDFAHQDFLVGRGKDLETRFIAIWDQGGSSRRSPQPWGYGSELTADQLNRAVRLSVKEKVPANLIEEQSQQVVGSHGTHVASIAAGKSGICRNAKIAAVLVNIPNQELERKRSFYDSTRVAHAVEYLLKIAEREKKALSINISLGTNGHAHDGSSSISRWIDHALAVPGRCVTVAAGNAGQEAARYEGDLGYLMGRIHTSGSIPARELYRDLEWIVVGNGIVDVSENELEIWYGAQDRFAVQLRPPGGDWIGPYEPQEFIENQQLKDSRLREGNGSFISIYNELYHPANGVNYISIYLTPFLDRNGVIGVPAGTWMVRLIGREVRDGRFHGWIERDDPRPAGRVGERQYWRFPSFFGDATNIDDSSVNSLACGRHIISVTNLDQATERINITSSQGPTRDGRFKPDVCASGTNITAAKGFSTRDDPWITMSGTSMASPHVCGIAGLMLNINPNLTSSQIEGIMQRTAQPLPGATFAWKNDAGYGRIVPAKCLEEAASAEQRKDRTR